MGLSESSPFRVFLLHLNQSIICFYIYFMDDTGHDVLGLHPRRIDIQSPGQKPLLQDIIPLWLQFTISKYLPVQCHSNTNVALVFNAFFIQQHLPDDVELAQHTISDAKQDIAGKTTRFSKFQKQQWLSSKTLKILKKSVTPNQALTTDISNMAWVRTLKVCFHYPSSQPEFTGSRRSPDARPCTRPVLTGVWFPLPKLTARVDGCQKMHPSSRAVNLNSTGLLQLQTAIGLRPMRR